jgi:molecular chaperone GrpE
MPTNSDNPSDFNPEEFEDAAPTQTTSPDQPAPADAGEASEIEKLRAERDELFERLARATADFKNSQKRLQADKHLAVQFANSALIKSLLPIIDNFERVLAQDPAKVDSATMLKGMQIVYDQFVAELRKQHVEAIAPNRGDVFDPNLHQAVMQEVSTEFPQNTVMQVLSKGYLHHDRILRPAMVSVSKPE